MASLLFVVTSFILLALPCHSIQSFDEGYHDSYFQYKLTNEHYKVKRNADESVAKKTAITKKPTSMKPEVSQKTLGSKATDKQTSKDVSQHLHHAISNISLTFIDGEVNDTLPTGAINETTEDHHTYYNSTIYLESEKAMSFWVNLTTFVHQTVTHEMLSNSHRRAATVALPFEFRFYGHPTTNITIATGGFLYVGDHVHSWLAATQYIAALMANFDTSLSNDSIIQYGYNETAFVVQWSNVMLKDKKSDGKFTFQIILLDNGDIIFVYKDIPFPIADIPDKSHPVKVGISDAYVIDRTVFFIRRKTIYEYHRADLKQAPITNNSAIYFKALPTCISLTTCDDCLNANIGFKCRWCDVVNRCSDGYDRHRQDWITRDCEKSSKDVKCSKSATHLANMTYVVTERNSHLNGIDSKEATLNPYSVGPESGKMHKTPSSGGAAGVVSSLVILAFLSGLALWVFYAYRNPTTTAGQFLIKYRPNRWRWGGSEARYTAASIHM